MASKQLQAGELNGYQKAAIFLMSAGEEFTTYFMKTLDKQTIRKIGQCMPEISNISTEVVNEVMDDFLKTYNQTDTLMISGKEFFASAVRETLGEDDADLDLENEPFENLVHLSPEQLTTAIRAEHPQTIALILSYVSDRKAAEVLHLLPEDIRIEVAYRLTDLGDVPMEFVRELDQTIQKNLIATGTSSREFDGIEALASILNQVDGTTEENIMAYLEKQDADLAQSVRQKMFVFEDLIEFDNKNFREILQNVDSQLLIKALKTASEELKEKVFQNLSQRAAEMLREDMEVIGPVRLSDVEQAQLEILSAAKRLEAEGRVIFPGKGKEDVLV
ncbi:MAG: flagellar motor switch protein FliG [Desulfotignum sp.]|nr:flagellar motor switch protein FliG [Desulfotignum sp.]MCF8136451.1 flagellar motor switch protein FliG [Desulfotignum sp.]